MYVLERKQCCFAHRDLLGMGAWCKPILEYDEPTWYGHRRQCLVLVLNLFTNKKCSSTAAGQVDNVRQCWCHPCPWESIAFTFFQVCALIGLHKNMSLEHVWGSLLSVALCTRGSSATSLVCAHTRYCYLMRFYSVSAEQDNRLTDFYIEVYNSSCTVFSPCHSCQ